MCETWRGLQVFLMCSFIVRSLEYLMLVNRLIAKHVENRINHFIHGIIKLKSGINDFICGYKRNYLVIILQ